MTEQTTELRERNERLWDVADDLLEMLNIEDTNPPSLTEAIADRLRPLFEQEANRREAEVVTAQIEKDANRTVGQ